MTRVSIHDSAAIDSQDGSVFSDPVILGAVRRTKSSTVPDLLRSYWSISESCDLSRTIGLGFGPSLGLAFSLSLTLGFGLAF